MTSAPSAFLGSDCVPCVVQGVNTSASPLHSKRISDLLATRVDVLSFRPLGVDAIPDYQAVRFQSGSFAAEAIAVLPAAFNATNAPNDGVSDFVYAI